MIKRVVEVGSPARLRVQHRQLVVDLDEGAPVSIPIEDMGVLLLDHPEVTITVPVLVALADAGAAVVACGPRHLPVLLALPMAGNSLHAQIVAAQADASRPRAKRLWQRVVMSKIRAQANCLRDCGRVSDEIDVRFAAFAANVRSGDPENIEAQAARAYWPLLFDAAFRRDQDAKEWPTINAALNYGYAVVRAAVARAVVGSGLHPALGIHHCNQYNAFALADDLMEPLRPAVDAEVFGLWQRGELGDDLTRAHRITLVGILTRDLDVGDGRRLPFLAGLPLFTAAVARWLAEETDDLPLPPKLWSDMPRSASEMKQAVDNETP